MLSTKKQVPTKIIQKVVNLDEFKKEFGEISWETSLSIAKVLKLYLNGDKKFTGKLVFTVNCRNGGVGNTNAAVLTEI